MKWRHGQGPRQGQEGARDSHRGTRSGHGTRYIEEYRNFLDIEPGYEDTLFLGRRGRELTQMVFTMLRRTTHEAGIRKQ